MAGAAKKAIGATTVNPSSEAAATVETREALMLSNSSQAMYSSREPTCSLSFANDGIW